MIGIYGENTPLYKMAKMFDGKINWPKLAIISTIPPLSRGQLVRKIEISIKYQPIAAISGVG